MPGVKELTWHATAAANILEARKQHNRLGRPKSRTGCLTCKKRRMKCDETRPACLKCSTTGRKCEGYRNIASMLSASQNARTALVGVQLSQCLGLEEKDRRTFNYFLSWSAPRLAGSLDKHFWCRGVLQIAQAEPVILDALLAISTLYEHPQFMRSFCASNSAADVVVPDPRKQEIMAQFSTSTLPETFMLLDTTPQWMSATIDEDHRVALKYYNRAIHRTVAAINAGNGDPLILQLSCALFICIEIMRDNVFAALKLFNQGTSMLRSFDHPSSIPESMLFDKLKLLYGRLSVFASIFGHVTGKDIFPSPHCSFDSLDDARTALFAIAASSEDFVHQAYDFKDGIDSKEAAQRGRAAALRTVELDDFSTTPGGVPPRSGSPDTFLVNSPLSNREKVRAARFIEKDPDAFRVYFGCDNAFETPESIQRVETITERAKSVQPPAELISRRDELLSQLHQWRKTFYMISGISMNHECAAGIMMQWHTSYIWVQTRLETTQTVFDKYTHNFLEILRLSEIYIKSKGEMTIFSLEMGTVAPLFLTATKCRIPSIRRKAIELLNRAPRKECLWRARSCAEVAAVLIAVEEEDLWLHVDLRKPSHLHPSDPCMLSDTLLPPESSRVHTFELIQDRVARRCDVRMTRYTSLHYGTPKKYVSDHPIGSTCYGSGLETAHGRYQHSEPAISQNLANLPDRSLHEKLS